MQALHPAKYGISIINKLTKPLHNFSSDLQLMKWQSKVYLKQQQQPRSILTDSNIWIHIKI